MEEKKYGDIGYVHKLDLDDVKMFEEITKTSKSENEKHFFRIMEYRQKHHCSPEYDYLLDSEKNPDKVGFTREWYDEYMLWIDGDEKMETNSLSFFLTMDLGKYIYERTGCQTLLEYLRSIDYSRIDYNADTEFL